MEIEFKFRADPETQAAVFRRFGGNFQVISMETTYYDTPERLLAARRMTLRHRLENGRHICTLKTPAKNGARGEWETERENIRDAVSELCKPAGLDGTILLASGLEPTCGARFTRRAKTVPTADGTAEIALDRGVLLGGGREEDLCEIEVELKSGSAAAAEELAANIAAEFGLEQQPLSKFRRALRLAEGEK